MAQICAEALGVDYRRVRVIHGQTDLIDHGIGAHAVRATVLTRGAVHVTAGLVRDKALEFAAELLQTLAAELGIVDGTVVRRDRKAPRSRSRRSRARERIFRDNRPGVSNQT
jgi:carbon-monoxide dehydrogenase large subunit